MQTWPSSGFSRVPSDGPCVPPPQLRLPPVGAQGCGRGGEGVGGRGSGQLGRADLGPPALPAPASWQGRTVR